MTSQAPLEKCIAVDHVQHLGLDVYTNRFPLTSKEGVRSVFGGSLVSQALLAASATVPAAFQVYSAQSSFLEAADSRKKVVYRVERISDGRAYSTRVVRATQGEISIYVAVLSFQSIPQPVGHVLQYQTPLPDLNGIQPDDIDTTALESMQASKLDQDVPLMSINPKEMPFDWRFIGMEITDNPSEFRIRSFGRSPRLSHDDNITHIAAFAYMSDEFGFGPALLANPGAVGKGMRNVVLGATLTHHISIHDPCAKVDEWIVIERETFWGADGRVLVHQKIWNLESGRLIISGTQEALIRLKGPKL